MVIDPEGTRLPIKLDSTSNGEPHFLTYGPKTRREFLRLNR